MLEGEGWFGLAKGDSPKLSLSMTDKDVVERVRDVFGFGQISNRPLPSGKTAFTWRVNEQHRAVGVMMTLLPLMGERRANKICDIISAWKSKPTSKAFITHCKHGHPLSGENLRIAPDGIYKKRRCKACVRNRQKKYRAKMRGEG